MIKSQLVPTGCRLSVRICASGVRVESLGQAPNLRSGAAAENSRRLSPAAFQPLLYHECRHRRYYASFKQSISRCPKHYAGEGWLLLQERLFGLRAFCPIGSPIVWSIHVCPRFSFATSKRRNATVKQKRDASAAGPVLETNPGDFPAKYRAPADHPASESLSCAENSSKLKATRCLAFNCLDMPCYCTTCGAPEPPEQDSNFVKRDGLCRRQKRSLRRAFITPHSETLGSRPGISWQNTHLFRCIVRPTLSRRMPMCLSFKP